VWALAQLSHVILSDVESGGTTLDRAVFLAHYAHRVAFDGPERRAEFHRRAIAELRSLDAAHTEQCGKLYLHASRCQRCHERPAKQCELRIVEEVAGALLNEQKAEQRRNRAMIEWEKAVWPVWAVLSWIVFRLPEQICAVVDEREFNAERLHGDRWRAAEGALLSALQAGMLDAVKDRNPLLATHWWGPVRIEADTWFSRDRVIDLWPAPRLPLADYLAPDYDDNGRFAVHRQHEENQIGSHEDRRGDHHEESGDLVPGRQRLAERPLSKSGQPTVVTAAWDVIGLHDEWCTRGIPAEWSVQKATNEINKHLRSLIRNSRFNVLDYPLNTRNDRHEISADSVKRALETRRPRRT
jgi:hypothetical protein